MRIYVACLASYVSGKLHGAWIDVDDGDVDRVNAEIQAMLKDSPVPGAEEFAIHDYEGVPSGFALGEHESICRVCDIAEFLAENDAAVVSAAIAWQGASDLNRLREVVTEGYRGAWDSAEAFAEDFYEELGELEKVPEFFRAHIDWESVADELDLGGDFTFINGNNGRVYVFDGRV